MNKGDMVRVRPGTNSAMAGKQGKVLDPILMRAVPSPDRIVEYWAWRVLFSNDDGVVPFLETELELL